MYALVMTVNRKGRKHSPRSPGVPQVRPEHGAHPNTTVNTNTYRYPHISPDPYVSWYILYKSQVYHA